MQDVVIAAPVRGVLVPEYPKAQRTDVEGLVGLALEPIEVTKALAQRLEDFVWRCRARDVRRHVQRYVATKAGASQRRGRALRRTDVRVRRWPGSRAGWCRLQTPS